MKKKRIMVPLFIIGIIGLIFFSGCLQEGTGTLVMKITDAPANLNVTHVNMTITQIQVHLSAGGGNNTTAGWYTVVNESHTFDLVALEDVTEFFCSVNLSVGMYTQIRLIIDSCVITIDGVEYDCTVPSGSIKLISPFVLRANETTTLTLDFDAQESISETGNHTYKFQPVIKVLHE